MKTQKSILIAFLLNLTFSIFEFIGGLLTNSVAIMSDAFHDMADAMSISVSYFLEKKSTKKPDFTHSYGYKRYSVLGGLLTTVVLIVGSVLVIINAVKKIINPSVIDYDKMIIFAVVGVVVNLVCAIVTHSGDSINKKAVNLHMLEDVLGWVVVLVGAVVMRFTDFALLDPIMSIAVASFILINAIKNLKKVNDIFLLKTPENVSVKEVEEKILSVSGVEDVHHIHLWSIDGYDVYATMHIITDENSEIIKQKVKEKLRECGVSHITLELERCDENCCEMLCAVSACEGHHHHHHHHHHH